MESIHFSWPQFDCTALFSLFLSFKLQKPCYEQNSHKSCCSSAAAIHSQCWSCFLRNRRKLQNQKKWGVLFLTSVSLQNSCWKSLPAMWCRI